VPGRPVSKPSPKVHGAVSKAGSNFIIITNNATTAEAKPSGMPMARSTTNAISVMSEMVAMSIERLSASRESISRR